MVDWSELESPSSRQPSCNSDVPSKFDHAVVRIVSAAINPVDCKVAAGYIARAWPTTLPFVGGYDAAGVIHKLPIGYSGELKQGDRVYTRNWGKSRHWDSDSTTQGGAFGQFALFPVHKIARIPSGVSYDTAAGAARIVDGVSSTF